jgi:hypothetical protein
MVVTDLCTLVCQTESFMFLSPMFHFWFLLVWETQHKHLPRIIQPRVDHFAWLCRIRHTERVVPCPQKASSLEPRFLLPVPLFEVYFFHRVAHMDVRQPEVMMGSGKAVLLGSIGIYCTVCRVVHSCSMSILQFLLKRLKLFAHRSNFTILLW